MPRVQIPKFQTLLINPFNGTCSTAPSRLVYCLIEFILLKRNYDIIVLDECMNEKLPSFPRNATTYCRALCRMTRFLVPLSPLAFLPSNIPAPLCNKQFFKGRKG